MPYEIVDGYAHLLFSQYCNKVTEFVMHMSLYSVILSTVYGFFKTFSSIVIVQMFVSFLTTIILVVVMKNLTKYIFGSINWWLVLLVTGLYILSTENVYFTSLMRPEIWSHLFEVGMIFLWLKIIESRYYKKSLKLVNFYSLGLVLTSFFAVLVQDKLFLPAVVNIVVLLFMYRRIKWNPFVSSFCLLIPILLGITVYYQYSFTGASTENWAITHLFLRNQDVLINEIKYDLKSGESKYSPEILKIFIDNYLAVEKYYPKDRNISIDDFDYIYYSYYLNSGAYDNQNKFLSKEGINDFHLYYLKQSVVNRPWEYIKKYGNEMWSVFGFGSDNLINLNDSKVEFGTEYVLPMTFHVEKYPFPYKDCAFFKGYIDESYKVYLKGEFVNADNIFFVNFFYDYISRTYGLMLLLVIYLVSLKRYRNKTNYREWLVLGLVLSPMIMYSYTAMIHLFIGRYTYEIFPLVLIGYVTMVVYVWKIIFGSITKKGS